MPDKIRIDAFSDEEIARLRQRYEAGDETILGIAEDFGVTYRIVNALARRNGWMRNGARRAKPRKPAAKAKRSTAPPRKAGRAAAPAGVVLQDQSLASRIRAALEAEIESLQADSTGASAATLASLARSLSNLRAYEAATDKAGKQDDGPPLDPAELRRELSRRLAVLRERPEGD
ncbi:MAG: hypothetical protein KGM42_10620 [Hyphomicrobiales bacterium]|nr:hypothetical protein [Hyphomicrobiales bacterium]